jgi:hypothetical protein
MSCHNNENRQALYESLKAIDPSLPPAYRFWHPRGTANGGTASRNDVAQVCDSAWLAATLSNDNYEHQSPSEQLVLLNNFMTARNAIVEMDSHAQTVAALKSYVNTSTRALERRDNNMVSKLTKKGLLVLGVTALLSAGIAIGSVGPQVSEASPSKNNVTYSAPSKQQCVDGAEKVLLKKGELVTWQWKSGRQAPKVLKKNRAACVVPVTQSNGLTVNADGVITALPVNFPKQPTVADIQTLGLTAESKVAPNLRIPQPKSPAVVAKLADTVTPISAHTVEIPNVTGWTAEGGNVIDGTKTIVMVTWELRGGSGVINVGNGTQVKFVDGVARVTTSIGSTEEFSHGQMRGRINTAGVTNDYGQTELPASVMKDWRYIYAKDASGIGNPVGVNANPAIIKPNSDGTVLVSSDFSVK